jgi:hypothetical protein
MDTNTNTNTNSNTKIDTDYDQVMYNINERMNKQLNPTVYEFNGEITKHHINIYNSEKARKIIISKNKNKNNNIDLNVDLWDISFSSSYGFPNNKVGFYGQWIENKLAPIAKYLSGIDLNENVHICYKLINENDEPSLDYLCDNITMGNYQEHRYIGRRTSGYGEDNIITWD